jgi:hypothetical protein
MVDYTAPDYAAAGITLAEDIREARRVLRRRRAIRCAAMILGAAVMFSAGALVERAHGPLPVPASCATEG